MRQIMKRGRQNNHSHAHSDIKKHHHKLLHQSEVMPHRHPSHPHDHSGHGHSHHFEVNAKTIGLLIVSFIINMILSVVELVAGLLAGSVALIGDALHNTSDAFSILIAVIAYKIGQKKADEHYTYGFKRAEVLGGFVNLILLFISGVYLLVEGIGKLISPQQIDGSLIVWVSAFALIIDVITARLSHHDAHHNGNMKMLFIHNLADALGSVGVIISGLCVMYFGWLFVDGMVALMIAAYMIFQSVVSFPKFVRILMNAAPDHIHMEDVRLAILSVKGVKDIHHIHLWLVSEHNVSLECHIVADTPAIIKTVRQKLYDEFNITHCNIQIETDDFGCADCCLSV